MSIPLYDDFNNSLGEFTNYDTYDSGQRTQLARQKHVDIRSFQQALITAPYSMFSLAAETTSFLDGLTTSGLESAFVVETGESWSAGTVGPQSDRKNFSGISLSCTTGTNTTFSVDGIVNLSTFTSADFISLALPAFPLASLTLASTFLDLTSEPSGNFTTGPTDSIAFSSSSTTLTAGDCEARFAMSLLTHVNLSAITGVRLRIQATGSCTFRCLAIRCLATTWEFAPIDQNTLYGRLGATVPPSGSVSQAFSFPAASGPVTPADWPILLWSDGASGPAAVNAEIGAVIQTGANSAQNTFTVYLRELALIPNSMSTLDAMTLSAIEALGQEPDYAPGTLDNFAQTHFITASVQWGTSSSVHIKDQSGAGYDFTSLTLAAQSSYYLLVRLEDDSLRVQIYPVSTVGMIDWSTVVFDSTAVIDSTFLPRRRGRIGWYAQLNEGDTFIDTLRPRRVVYGEYRSAPLASMTPVEGARLYTSTSPDVLLYQGATATAGATISPDVTKSRSGNCVKVFCTGTLPFEGLVASAVRYEDLYDTVVEFDVLAPADTPLTALLRGEGRLIGLYLPPLPANQWAHIKIPLDSAAPLVMPGIYSLYIVQTSSAQNTWFIDNPSIRMRSVSWSGRGQAGDSRKVNVPAWVKFGDAINDPHNGVLFGRGNTLQIRGQAITQTGSITSLSILPKYSTLGNFVWADQAPSYPSAPVPSFTTSSVFANPMSIACDGTASAAAGGIIDYYWTFGDGSTGFGSTITHTYTTHGTYVINLTLIDDSGQKVSTTQSVTV